MLILIADDDPITCALLQSLVKKMGHDSVVCNDGEAAYEIMISKPTPHIALLDWSMPKLTGIEACRRLYAREDASYIYKIIISGLIDKNAIVEALHLGIDDVLLKPINGPTLMTRITLAARTVQERRSLDDMNEVLQRYANHMEELAKERAKQLAHAERMSSLGVMSAGIAHEINNPLSFISGNVQTLKRYWSDIEPLIQAHIADSADKSAKISFVVNEMPKVLGSIMSGVERVTKIIKGLKKYSGQSSTEREVVDINHSIKQVLELCRCSLGKKIVVELNLSEKAPQVLGSIIELEQVLTNVIVNASNAIEGRESPFIKISSCIEGPSVKVSVVDNGSGIPEEIINKIWNPFFTTKPIGKGTGLGLSISSGIIRQHGGEISAHNLTSGGACFDIVLPIVGEDKGGMLQ